MLAVKGNSGAAVNPKQPTGRMEAGRQFGLRTPNMNGAWTSKHLNPAPRQRDDTSHPER
jgi:hypothetical protein